MTNTSHDSTTPPQNTPKNPTTSDVKTSNPQLIHDPSSIYYLHPFEGPDMSLTKYECYDIINGPRINQLKTKYHTLRQKGMYVVSFYNKFKAIWEELYGSKDATCGCICPAAALLKERFELGKNT
ncbi:hypothetical protein LIER_04690 [Lithospermum erythrorhizon]|uniref:Uncharacterized protein n=1 Tax=Lithospermum erythrorhizon TaxID=34254 RepID=A0AAV3NZI8_LITER